MWRQLYVEKMAIFIFLSILVTHPLMLLKPNIVKITYNPNSNIVLSIFIASRRDTRSG